MSGVIERDFNCPYASNSYHDCTEICFKKLSEKLQIEGNEPVQDKGIKKAQRKGVTPIFSKPLRSFNSHARNFLSFKLAAYQGRTNKILLISDNNDVHSSCKHTSNPYHRCAEYCFNNIPNRNQPNQVMKLNSTEGDNAFNVRGRTSLQSQCIDASNLRHECSEVCFQNGQDSNTHEEENSIDVSTNTDESSLLPNHIHASVPFHKDVECYTENTPEHKHPHKALNPKEEIKTLEAAESGVKVECKNAFPYHIDDEICFQNLHDDHDFKVMKLNSLEGDKAFNVRGRAILQCQCIDASNLWHECSEVCFQNGQDSNTHEGENSIDVSINTDESSLLPNHIHASIPYHTDVECCIENSPEQKHPHKALNPKEEIKTLEAVESGVKVECKNAPPYYIDDEICFQNILDDHDLKAMMKAKEEIEVIAIPQRAANLNCESMSHPYIEYCSNNVLEKDKLELKDKIALTRKLWVNPECQFALNPYHACAEYCFENATERERHGYDKKQKSLRKFFSNKETTTVHSRCTFASNPYHECGTYCIQKQFDQNKAVGANTKLKEKKEVHGERGVDPKCQFTSNPYHVCAEYCIQNVPGHVITKENMRYSRSEKRCHLIMERSTANLEFVEATKPTCNKVESSIGIIFPGQMDKSSKDSKFLEASNSDTDYAEFSKGITMQIVTEDLMPDVQPILQLDASHLFLEWVKYCSQEMTAEYKIIVQARRGFETNVGQDKNNFKFYNSSIIEKFKAEGSLQLSLYTTVLFFLGFLFALFNGHK